MADGTQRRWKTTAWRGATRIAPTAPHATPPSDAPGSPEKKAKRARRSGPERFWWPRYLVPVLAAAFVLSIAAHVAFFGRSLFFESNFEFEDQDGEATIPIELLAGDPEPEPEAPSEPPVAPPPAAPVPNGTDNALDAGLAIGDASARTDAAAPIRDAASPEPHDASPPSARDAASDFTSPDASEIAVADAGAPRDAVGLVGAAGSVNAGPPLVNLLVNMSEIRKNAIGAQLGPLMSAIPQWDEFMAGTHVDPVRDADWILISGPSLRDTSRDIILVHYSMADAIADRAISLIQSRSSNGAPYDTGVAGVKASLAHADRAPRVFMRPQSRLVAVVPPDVAKQTARQLSKAKVAPRVRPGEAMRLILMHPHGPFPQIFPEEMTELDVWIIPRADGGADLHGDGICSNEQIAQSSVAQIKGFLKNFRNSMIGGGVNLMTNGVLDDVVITQDGAHEKLDATVTVPQLEALLNLAAGQLGVALPASGASPAPASPHAKPH